MTRTFLLLLFIYVTIVSNSSYANGCIVPEQVYAEASHYILSNDYQNALTILDRFMRDFPDEPAGPLLKAAILQYRSTDYEDFSDQEIFFKLIVRTEYLARKKLEMNGDDLWALYYLSASENLKGVWIAASGKFIRGIITCWSGVRGMANIVSMDSTFYDAYLVIGSFRFWRGMVIENVSMFPFVKTDVKSALDKVEVAISRGKLTGPLSYIVLIEMLLEHDPFRAVELGEDMVKKYSDCRLFLWQLGEAYKKLGRFDEAVRVFTEIADSMACDNLDDGSGELRCWWKLAELSKSVGKVEECRYYCNKVIELGERKSIYTKQYKRINKAIHMIEDIDHE